MESLNVRRLAPNKESIGVGVKAPYVTADSKSSLTMTNELQSLADDSEHTQAVNTEALNDGTHKSKDSFPVSLMFRTGQWNYISQNQVKKVPGLANNPMVKSAGQSARPSKATRKSHIQPVPSGKIARMSASPRMLTNQTTRKESSMTLKHSPIKPKLAKITTINPNTRKRKDYVPLNKQDSEFSGQMETLMSGR